MIPKFDYPIGPVKNPPSPKKAEELILSLLSFAKIGTNIGVIKL
jgi:hypothetical protein